MTSKRMTKTCVFVFACVLGAGCAGNQFRSSEATDRAKPAESGGSERQVPARASKTKVATEHPDLTLTSVNPTDGDERTVRELERSAALFRQFLEKAGNDPRYAEAIERTHERLEDIKTTLEFVRRGIEERRRREHER